MNHIKNEATNDGKSSFDLDERNMYKPQLYVLFLVAAKENLHWKSGSKNEKLKNMTTIMLNIVVPFVNLIIILHLENSYNC